MTPDELRICNVVDTLIRKNRSFALWRIPGESPRFAMQTSGSARILYHIEELDEQSGFVIAPFHVSKQHPIVLIRPDIQKLPPDEETKVSYSMPRNRNSIIVKRLSPSPKTRRKTTAVVSMPSSNRYAESSSRNSCCRAARRFRQTEPTSPLPPLSSRQPDGTNIHMFISAILPRQAHGSDVRLKSSSPARKENGIRSPLPAPNLSKTGNYR